MVGPVTTTISIVLDGVALGDNALKGRMAMIDIGSSDTDGSEVYSLQMIMPYGVTISDGTHSISNPYRRPIVMDMSDMDLGKLTLQTTERYCGDLVLTLFATSREISNGSDAMSTYDIKVTVLQGKPAICKYYRPAAI